jgi:hypothetical protein
MISHWFVSFISYLEHDQPTNEVKMEGLGKQLQVELSGTLPRRLPPFFILP